MMSSGDPFVRSGMAPITRAHIQATLSKYWGFLVRHRHVPIASCNDSRILTDPNNLAEFWRYLATPEHLNGRGNSRASVRAQVTYMHHILGGLQSLGQPCAPPYTWRDVQAWWKGVATPMSRCALLPTHPTFTQ